ncbi:MAG: hypothetical protein SGJ20_16945, partial [Planctomycetota bacterium]|nr:hypothetical protein [Planctomycetota bacterium]
SQSIRCQELVVVDRNDSPRVVVRGGAIHSTLRGTPNVGEIVISGDDNRPRVKIGAGPGPSVGEVAVFGPSGQAVVHLHGDQGSNSGVVETKSSDGRLQTKLDSAPDMSGRLLVYDSRYLLAVGIGHDGVRAGLLFIDPTGLRSGVMSGLPINNLIERAWNALPGGKSKSGGTSPKNDATKKPSSKRPSPSVPAGKAKQPAAVTEPVQELPGATSAPDQGGTKKPAPTEPVLPEPENSAPAPDGTETE